MAGRRRFYRNVSVANVSTDKLWFLSDATATKTDEESFVESPISAGVDGTQSASGVVLSKKDASFDPYTLLIPKRPSANPNSTINARAVDFSWYNVLLDGRPLKTPMGHPLVVPSEILAHALAAEWNAQSPSLVPAQMPLTTLVCTSIDQTTHQVVSYQEQALKYLPTDTISYWADPMEDRVLYQKQEQAFRPIVQNIQAVCGHKPAVLYASDGLLLGKNAASSSSSSSSQSSLSPHPTELHQYGEQWTQSLDAWQLTAVHAMASEAKSFCMAMALMNSTHGRQATTTTTDDFPLVSVDQVIQAARVEEEFQIANWGLVEGGHDYDRLNCSVQLHSAVFLTHCLAHALQNVEQTRQ